MKYLRRLSCFIWGHSDELAISSTRLVMRCVSCGDESAGFDLDTPAPIAKGKKILRFKKRMAA